MKCSEFSIVTLNTWKCDGKYEKRIELLIREIKELNPDIIAFQESFETVDQTYNTAKYVAKKCNFDYRYVRARRKDRLLNQKQYDSFSGLAILSKFAFQEHYYFDLPTNSSDGGRKMQLVTIKLSNKKVLLINCHLTFLKNAVSLRKQQLKYMLEVINNFEGYDAKLLCGDFNTTTQSEEIKNLFQTSHSLKDTYETGGGNIEEAYTIMRNKGNDVFKSKIDHILSLSTCDDLHPRFKNAKIVFNIKDTQEGIYVSDHFGVYTTCVLHD